MKSLREVNWWLAGKLALVVVAGAVAQWLIGPLGVTVASLSGVVAVGVGVGFVEHNALRMLTPGRIFVCALLSFLLWVSMRFLYAGLYGVLVFLALVPFVVAYGLAEILGRHVEACRGEHPGDIHD